MDSLDPLARQTPDPGTSGRAQIILVEPDPEFRWNLDSMLTREGYAVVLAPDGRAALDRLRAGGVDLVISELKMPGFTGLELLRTAKILAPDVEVIMMTTFCTVQEAVQAMKEGASDFLSKPVKSVRLITAVKQVLARWSLAAESRLRHQRLDDLLPQDENMIGVSPAFRSMMTLVQQVADSAANVLIQGGNGTGRELVARAIHSRSPRRNGPFVVVDCSAQPESLVESDLFGDERSISMGGSTHKKGRFELANDGTLFLNEVADLPAVIQLKILRVLLEGEFERAGGIKTIRVRVRVITATSQDLTSMVRDKRLREDLFYRLNVITIVCPPLRERREDIPLLAQHVLRIYAEADSRRLDGFSDEALGQLEAYPWPGNITELEGVVQRAVVLARGSRLELTDLPDNITSQDVMLPRAKGDDTTVARGEEVFTIRIGTPLVEIERRLLEETLRLTKGNRTLTAKMLGIDPKTVFRKLRQDDIVRRIEPT